MLSNKYIKIRLLKSRALQPFFGSTRIKAQHEGLIADARCPARRSYCNFQKISRKYVWAYFGSTRIKAQHEGPKISRKYHVWASICLEDFLVSPMSLLNPDCGSSPSTFRH
jgi:hypothetical protein